MPTVELAKEAGSERALNMVMIGALCARTGLLTMDECFAGMEAALEGRSQFFSLNRTGIERGFRFIREGS